MAPLFRPRPVKEEEPVTAELTLEKKSAQLKKQLSRDLAKKHNLELKINEDFRALKQVEAAVEKASGSPECFHN